MRDLRPHYAEVRGSNQKAKGAMSMKFSHIFIIMTLAAVLLLVSPVPAQAGNTPTVIYQTAFSTDPQWTTNNPSFDYWDANTGMYHFSIEPSTGGYAYVSVPYTGGSFTLEYDLLLQQVDPGATFRLGLSGSEMDRSKGPNVLTEFTNAKYGNLFWLRVITPSQKLLEVSSQSGSYGGPTVTYALNKTYHVQVIYDDDSQTVTEQVTDKASGQIVWSYYLSTYEQLHDMNRIYVGAGGDYGMMYQYATGYIDNIRLYGQTPSAPVITASTPTISFPPTYTPRQTVKATTAPPAPTPTPTSPSSGLLVWAALGITSIGMAVRHHRKDR
jgi:hypothetical protein